MSIATEIDRIKQNIENAYSAIAERGGTLPDVQNSANLADAIKNIKAKITISASHSGFSLRGVGNSTKISLSTVPSNMNGYFLVANVTDTRVSASLSGSTLTVEVRDISANRPGASYSPKVVVQFIPEDTTYYAIASLTINGYVYIPN